jgi:hypothetical protein
MLPDTLSQRAGWPLAPGLRIAPTLLMFALPALALPAACDKDRSAAKSGGKERSGPALVKVTVRKPPASQASNQARKNGASRASKPGRRVATLRLALRASWPARHQTLGDPGARGDGILLAYPRARALGVSPRTASGPVDVVLLDSRHRVVRRVSKAAPGTARRVDVIPRLFRYALVLPAGGATEHHLVEGARADFRLPAGARPRDVLTEVSLSPPGASAVTVRAELAMTPAETSVGLMFRRSLPRGGGMLFRFPRPQRLTFYMKNTYVPLDMIFINDARRVTGVVHDAKPLDERMVGVGPVRNRYVLEVRAGFARRHRITAGTRVIFRLPE